jgi:hypothetical protein
VAARLRLSPGAWRRALPWAAVAALALALLLGRVLWSSRAELALGTAAYERGDWSGAILHLSRSAHWYAPGNPYATEALEQLRRIGRRAEMEGQVDPALAAYRAIRASCLGTRSFYTPHRSRLHEANRRIASLMARQSPPPMDQSKTVEQRQEEHLAILEHVEAPNPLLSLLACLAFLTWVGGAFGFIFRALDEDLHLRRQPALRWGVVVVGGLVVWAISLLLA